MRLYTLLKTIINNIQNNPGRIIRYGTSNGWDYEEYKNGKKVAYGTFKVSDQTPSAWTGGFYFRLLQIPSFPSGLFSSTPKVFVMHYNAVLGIPCGSVTTKTKTSIYVANAASSVSSQGFTLNVIAIEN